MGQTNFKESKKRNENATTRPKQARFNDATFIQYELDKALQAQCKAWDWSPDKGFQAVLSLCEVGYKITLKFDTFSDSYAAFMSQSNGTGPNAGFILTGRGSTPEKALKQLLFKHYEVMDQEWEQFAGFSRGAEIDD